MSKVLVSYISFSGVTKRVAEKLSKSINDFKVSLPNYKVIAGKKLTVSDVESFVESLGI